MLPLLTIKNLQIDFVTENETVHAARNITFTINRNEITGIAGESGSGKSVTAMSVLQLLPSPPARYISGELLFSPDGITQYNLIGAGKKELRSIRGKEIAMIFQEPMTSLNPVFTCGEQVMEAILLHENISRGEAEEKTISLFKKVRLPEPENIIHRYPHQLSGGQKQRVMIAMAMSSNPSLLICDEPTTALDVTVQQSILLLIKELQREAGMGVIFITHDLGVLAEIADRLIVMNHGEIVEQGPLKIIFTAPQQPYTKKLLGSRPPVFAKKKHEEILIRVENLSVKYISARNFLGKPVRYTTAVDNLSFEIFRGETLGLVGESGCGKTTLGRALLQLVEPSSGKIAFEGRDLRLMKGAELRHFRKNIQIVFQDPYSSLNPSIRIEMLEEPLKVHFPALTGAQRKKRVVELLEKVGLQAEHYQRYAHEFSGGQRQRIVIARALIAEPAFVICDESVSALDLTVQAQVLAFFTGFGKSWVLHAFLSPTTCP